MADLDPKTQDALHTELAENLLRELRGEYCWLCERGFASPQMLTVIRQFLADNGVTSTLRSKSPLRRLSEGASKVPFPDPEEQVTKPSKRTA